MVEPLILTSSSEPAPRFTVTRHVGISDERRSMEAAMLVQRITLPLSGRVAWLESFPEARSALYTVRNTLGEPVGGMVVEEFRSRALPGHAIWRVRYVDPAAGEESNAAALDAVLQAARADRRVLRVHFDIFSPDRGAREHFGSLLQARSLTKLDSPREHEWTLTLSLAAGVESVWNSLSTVRRNVRQVERGPFEVRVIDDESLAPRLDALLHETYTRTGGTFEKIDFASVIRLGKLVPTASRIVGLIDTAAVACDSLVAFAWGCRHGTHVAYSVGASSREARVRRYPLAYPLLWALIAWAGAEGAEWFDLGGVTQGTLESADRLGGISDFKRHFSREVVNVRDEWQYEPHPWRARVARTLTSGAAMLKQARGRVGAARIASATAARDPSGNQPGEREHD